MTMPIGVIVGAIFMMAVSVIVILVVAMQNPKNSNGLQALGGASNYAASNARSAGAILNKLVAVLAVLFMVITLVVYALVNM